MIIATVTAIIILLGGGAPAWYSNEIDLLRYLGSDPDTETILMYLEDISDGRKLSPSRPTTTDSTRTLLAINKRLTYDGRG